MEGWSYPSVNLEEVEEEEEEREWFQNLPLTYKIVFLRDKMRWSWRKITRFLFPHLQGKAFEKTMLKIYGVYVCVKRRMRDKEIITFHTITPPDLESLLEERDYLIKMMTIVEDEEKKKEIYKKLNMVKGEILLHLIIWRFNLEKESGKIFGVYEKLKNRVNWEKDHVKMSGAKTLEWVSHDLSALVITTFVSATGIRPYLRFLVDFLSSGNGKKKLKILKIIMDKYGDVVSQSVLLPFFT